MGPVGWRLKWHELTLLWARHQQRHCRDRMQCVLGRIKGRGPGGPVARCWNQLFGHGVTSLVRKEPAAALQDCTCPLWSLFLLSPVVSSSGDQHKIQAAKWAFTKGCLSWEIRWVQSSGRHSEYTRCSPTGVWASNKDAVWVPPWRGVTD